MNTTDQTVLSRLADDVAGYTTPHFVLRHDLGALERVLRSDAPEAVILYCARILETLAGSALRLLAQDPSPNSFSNLQQLDNLGRLSTATNYWAHGLRRLGNQVRHIHGAVDQDAAVMAVLFAEHWLDWFFCQFSHGQKLASLTKDQHPLRLTNQEELTALMRHLQGGEQSPSTWQPDPILETACRRTAVTTAVCAEILIGRNKLDQARGLLEAALQEFPTDLRLRQLLALCWSRGQQLPQALKELQALAAQFPADEETAGILAGVYKRAWFLNRADNEALSQAFRSYRSGWNSSGKKNTYLGINTATTALFLERRQEASQVAAAVAQLLHQRKASLPAGLQVNFWDEVTHAEAVLLGGDPDTAGRMYAAVFEQHPHRDGDIAVARRQRDEIARALNLDPSDW